MFFRYAAQNASADWIAKVAVQTPATYPCNHKCRQDCQGAHIKSGAPTLAIICVNCTAKGAHIKHWAPYPCNHQCRTDCQRGPCKSLGPLPLQSRRSHHQGLEQQRGGEEEAEERGRAETRKRRGGELHRPEKQIMIALRCHDVFETRQSEPIQ